MFKKKLMIVLFGLVVLIGFMPKDIQADTEVTFGFEWKNSFHDVILRDYSFPFTLVFEDKFGKWYDYYYYLKKFADFDLVKESSRFQRGARFMFGLDFSVYKGLTLGFELNAGVIERRIKEVHKKIHFRTFDPNPPDENDPRFRRIEIEEERVNKEIVIPVNLLVDIKYKFEAVRKATGFLRPYIGCGGGITTAINFSDQFIGQKISQLPKEEIYFSGIGVAMAGIDVWVTKKFAIFGEVRFVKTFKNKREYVAYVAGFRFD